MRYGLSAMARSAWIYLRVRLGLLGVIVLVLNPDGTDLDEWANRPGMHCGRVVITQMAGDLINWQSEVYDLGRWEPVWQGLRFDRHEAVPLPSLGPGYAAVPVWPAGVTVQWAKGDWGFSMAAVPLALDTCPQNRITVPVFPRGMRS